MARAGGWWGERGTERGRKFLLLLLLLLLSFSFSQTSAPPLSFFFSPFKTKTLFLSYLRAPSRSSRGSQMQERASLEELPAAATRPARNRRSCGKKGRKRKNFFSVFFLLSWLEVFFFLFSSSGVSPCCPPPAKTKTRPEAGLPRSGGAVAVDEVAPVPDRSDLPSEQHRPQGDPGEVEEVLRDRSPEERVVLHLADQRGPPPERERRERERKRREERERMSGRERKKTTRKRKKRKRKKSPTLLHPSLTNSPVDSQLVVQRDPLRVRPSEPRAQLDVRPWFFEGRIDFDGGAGGGDAAEGDEGLFFFLSFFLFLLPLVSAVFKKRKTLSLSFFSLTTQSASKRSQTEKRRSERENKKLAKHGGPASGKHRKKKKWKKNSRAYCRTRSSAQRALGRTPRRSARGPAARS